LAVRDIYIVKPRTLYTGSILPQNCLFKNRNSFFMSLINYLRLL